MDKRSQFSMGISISERPKEVAHRQTFGHWELDTMVSSRGASKGCLATFVERKSRLYTALLIPDRTAASMLAAITQLYRSLPKGVFKTATTDRGKDFTCSNKVYAELGIPLFLPMPIPPGNEVVMKTPTACFVSSIVRKLIWLR